MPDPIDDYAIIQAMRVHGGSFVQALGECFHRADACNVGKLKAAFPEYWIRYTEIAERTIKESV